MEWTRPYDEKTALRLKAKLKEADPFDDDTCWEWQGGTNDRRYGKMSIQNRSHYVHRVMWEIANNRYLEAHEVVMHDCDNSLCCNPNHLKIGSILENTQEAHQRGRMTHNLPRGSRKRRRNLTIEQVLQIKAALRYRSAWSVAKQFNIGHTTVRNIRDGTTWKNVKLP